MNKVILNAVINTAKGTLNMSMFNYNCSCGRKATFTIIDYKEYKCLGCGKILAVSWNFITNGFEVKLKEENNNEKN